MLGDAKKGPTNLGMGRPTPIIRAMPESKRFSMDSLTLERHIFTELLKSHFQFIQDLIIYSVIRTHPLTLKSQFCKRQLFIDDVKVSSAIWPHRRRGT